MKGLAGFLREVRRRKVFRVAVVYAATAFVILQAADLILPRLGVPDWAMSLVVVLTILGFPIALVLAWALELTPDGIQRAERRGAPDAAPDLLGTRTLFVSGMLVTLGVGLGAGWFLKPGSSPGDAASIADMSIAVLPFTNLSADPEQEFFADGITEDILTRLTRIDGLRVISRTSIMRYKGSTMSLPEIAAELGVAHVLEGSVRRVGDQLRITGQLIRADDDAHLWAESFDREMPDVFAIQTEIAEQIAEALAVRLSAQEREDLAERPTDDTRAYEQYLLGRAQINRSFSDFGEFEALVDEAEARFRAAIVEDPGYAEAWAGLSWVARSRINVDPEGAEAHYREAIDAARRATELAPGSATGYVHLGKAYLTQGLAEAALEKFDLASRLEPEGAELLAARASILRNQGRVAEAVRLLRQATRIEPGDANLFDELANTYWMIGDLPAAREAFELAWGRITPHEARLDCHVALVAAVDGDEETARRRIENALELESDSWFVTTCGVLVYLGLRDRGSLVEILDRWRDFPEVQRAAIIRAWVWDFSGSDEPLEPLLQDAEQQLVTELPRLWGGEREYLMALITLLGGDTEGALDQLERAFASGWRGYRRLLEPAWDPIRDVPRFQAIERRMDEDLERQRSELAMMEGPR